MKSRVKKWFFVFIVVIFIMPLIIYFFQPKAESQDSGSSQSAASAALKKQEQKATYLGPEKCKMCHRKRYDQLMHRKFTKSWKILEMRGETDNPKCLKCHTTGYGEPGGFVSKEKTPQLRYKSCEACHGPASLHAEDPSNQSNRQALIEHVKQKNVCAKCHIGVKAHGAGEF